MPSAGRATSAGYDAGHDRNPLGSGAHGMAGTLQPNGQPMFPNEPGTLLNDIIRDYNLQPAEAPPPYDFGLDTGTSVKRDVNAQKTVDVTTKRTLITCCQLVRHFD